jgi:hypothetical protein
MRASPLNQGKDRPQTPADQYGIQALSGDHPFHKRHIPLNTITNGSKML